MSAADVEELRRELAGMKTQVALCCERIGALQASIAKLWRIVIVVGLLSAGGAQAFPYLEKVLGG